MRLVGIPELPGGGERSSTDIDEEVGGVPRVWKNNVFSPESWLE